MIQPRKLLVTCALLYANGPLHLGHTLEQIQADIWVRFQRLRGHHCIFIGGEDAHGTAIMLAAKKQGIPPEQLIQEIFVQHQQDLQDFGISLDHFYTTHCTENSKLSALIYQRLLARGNIHIRTVEQAYDPVAKMFLPDRYIQGICPHCAAPAQYGDNCEACGATYNALDLKQATSTVSGTTPITKASRQHFLKLSHYSDFLQKWIYSTPLSLPVRNKLLEWFQTGLKDLAISREAPYFGYLIPGTTDKYFYVWLDAVIGYIAIFQNFCQQNPTINFEDYWVHANKVELHQVIGKDILNFHGLLWPALLQGSGFRLPTRLLVHGYLTINGLKMSKSRGTFITARAYLKHFHPDYLRYYLASKLGSSFEDIDLNSTDFVQKINADLVGKWVNIASRCAKLINQHFNNLLSAELDSPQIIEEFTQLNTEIARCFEEREYHQAVRHIMTLADKANQYLAQKKPWELVQNTETRLLAQQICTTGINLFRILLVYLKPILPHIAGQAEIFLGVSLLDWTTLFKPILQHAIQVYQPLLKRLDPAGAKTVFSSIE
jgi:methionyl-tRNA synthetase